MKPLSLKIDNMRSYRSHDKIIFSDAALIALLGNTGAGKSTLLDAIVLALFGCTLDPQLNLAHLIAPHEITMSVDLHFSLDGHEYSVYRMLRKSGAVGVHRLTKPDDSRIEGSREVTEAVEKLLGITAKTFLSTVLLPQGRFAALLLAKGSEKQAVFKEIFGLDQIEDVSKATSAELDRARERRAELRGARTALPVDPSAQSTQLTHELASAKEVLANAERLSVDVAAIEEQLRTYRQQLESGEGVIQRLSRIDDLSTELASLRGAQEALETKLEAAVRAIAASKRELTSAEAFFAQLKARSLDVASLRHLSDAMGAIEHEMDELRIEAQQLQRSAEALGTLERDLLAANEVVHAALEPHTRLQEKQHEFTVMMSDANAELTELTGVLREWVRLQSVWESESNTLEANRRRLAAVASAITGAKAQKDTAVAAFESARGVYEELRRMFTAASLAAHVHAGDVCPVCDQTVPQSYRPKPAPALDQAKSEYERAARHLEEMTGNLNNTEGKHPEIQHAFNTQADRVANAAAALQQQAAALEAVVGTTDVEEYLTVLGDRKTALEQELAAATSSVRGAEQQLQQAKSEVTRLSATKVEAASTLSTLQRRLEARKTKVQELYAHLPLEHSAVPKVLIATLEDTRTQELDRWLAEALATATQADEELVRLTAEMAARDKAVSDIKLAYAQSVTSSFAAFRTTLDGMAADMHLDHLPECEPADLVLDALLDQLLAIRTEASSRVKEVHIEAGRAQASLDNVLGLLPAAPLEIVAQEKFRVHTIEREIERLTKIIGDAQALDLALDAISPVSNALEALRYHLQVPQFRNYLAEARATRIVDIASRVLYEMTNQYRFTADFNIHDVSNNLERPSASLSGGEKFLASLALSLAVVEQAAVGGAKIESLFLDEGFATLDTTCLDIAMQELRKRASKGQSIWIITHLRDAAAYAHESFMVEHTPDGSKVRRLDEPIEETADAAGLLAVLS